MKNLYRTTARFYDLDGFRDNLTADIPFYASYAEKLGGEVLELACGTGRVSLALAENGARVTALDLSAEMLEIFRQKPGAEKIDIIHGNMADFEFNKNFSLIIAPFRAFQALTDDRDIKNSLACIKKHLTENGVFIINVFKPNRVMDAGWLYAEKTQWELTDEKTGLHIVKKHWGDKIDTEKQIIYPHYTYYVTGKDGVTERFTEDLRLKYYYREQLEELIISSGFEIKEEFGWYDKQTVEEADRELILVCGRNKCP